MLRAKTLKRLSLSSLIAWISFGTAMILVVLLLAVMRYEGRLSALESTETLFQEIASKTSARINIIIGSIAKLTETASLHSMEFDYNNRRALNSNTISMMKAILDDNPLLLSIYMGYTNGAFHQLIAPQNNKTILETYRAPPHTAYINRIITILPDTTREEIWEFLSPDLSIISTRTNTHAEFDPRIRPWYTKAHHYYESVLTDPYIFSSSQLPGITCAHILSNRQGVLGVDVTLAGLSEMLATQKISPNGLIWIMDAKYQLLALPGLTWTHSTNATLELPKAISSTNPVIAGVARKMETNRNAHTKEQKNPLLIEVNNEIYIASTMDMKTNQDQHLHIIIAAPLRDITGNVNRLAIRIVLVAAGLIILIIPLAMTLGHRAAKPVKALMTEAEKIQSFDFSPSPPINSVINEVNTLAQTYESMKATIRNNTDHLIETQNKLELLVKGGVALSTEKELSTLVSLIFHNARELTQADGGVLYVKEDTMLEVEFISLGTQQVHLGSMSQKPAPRIIVQPQIMAFLSKDSVLHSACQAFNTRQPVVIFDKKLSLFPTELLKSNKDYTISSLICVPIVTRRDEVLGVIQLFNPNTHAKSKNENTHEVIKFVASLAAQAAVTLDNRNLVDSLTALFDSVIQVVASSIDAKSPYTAGHCTRVPEITEMLAQAAHETDSGPLKTFRMETDEEWRQLFIAAWLHDCGKVTTPEFVVDKATKLETIHNRINEIRTRFEVLRRDEEITFLKRQIQGEANYEQLESEFNAALKQLEDDFAFVASCNVGTEDMTEEAKVRLETIANRTWLRHYSDRLGMSHIELRIKEKEPEPVLPVAEHVLADKPEHLFPQFKDYSHMNDAQGNPLDIPQHGYNRGELYNLFITRGTLTAEERFKINEHTLSGMEMLSKIPFPENLHDVPDIALAHHETLIGTGYPLKKSAKHLRIESRILAIADIFEALTASDRPYKKAKSLSEALRIMSFMRNDQHIDADLFDVFLKKGVFKTYAQKYLRPDQNDVEDITPYLHPSSS